MHFQMFWRQSIYNTIDTLQKRKILQYILNGIFSQISKIKEIIQSVNLNLYTNAAQNSFFFMYTNRVLLSSNQIIKKTCRPRYP